MWLERASYEPMKALESSDSPLKDTYLPAMISLRFYVTWKNLLLAYEGPRILWLNGQRYISICKCWVWWHFKFLIVAPGAQSVLQAMEKLELNRLPKLRECMSRHNS